MLTAIKQPLTAANDLYPKSSAPIITFMPRTAQPDRMLLVAVTTAMIIIGFMMGLMFRNMPKGNFVIGSFESGINITALSVPAAAPAPVAVAVDPLPPPPAPVAKEVPAEAPSAPAPAAVVTPPPAPLPAPAVQAPAPFDITLAGGEDPDAIDAADAFVPPAETETLEHMMKRAQILLAAGNSENALTVYQEALKLDADNPAALAGEAYSANAIGDFANAADADRQLLGIDPMDVTARQGLIAALGHVPGDASLKELQKLADEGPGTAALAAPFEAALASALARHNNLSSAHDHLLRAMRLDPGNIAYRLDLAVLYDHAGQAGEALALYRQVLDAAADSAKDPWSAAMPALPLDSVRARAEYLAAQDASYR